MTKTQISTATHSTFQITQGKYQTGRSSDITLGGSKKNKQANKQKNTYFLNCLSQWDVIYCASQMVTVLTGVELIQGQFWSSYLLKVGGWGLW